MKVASQSTWTVTNWRDRFLLSCSKCLSFIRYIFPHVYIFWRSHVIWCLWHNNQGARGYAFSRCQKHIEFDRLASILKQSGPLNYEILEASIMHSLSERVCRNSNIIPLQGSRWEYPPVIIYRRPKCVLRHTACGQERYIIKNQKEGSHPFIVWVVSSR